MSELEGKRRGPEEVFRAICLLALALPLALLAVLFVTVLRDGAARLSWDFITSYPSRHAAAAGILPALVGSAWLMGLTAIMAIPVGVGAALYLEEYAPQGRLTSAIELNISTLAGVPSIIYGILGLGVFVRLLGLGPTVLAGALTLTLLILPVVIIASIEALRAVPQAQREGAYALGATRWQVVRRSVLPAASPGIMTGVILAMARAVGEAAPLIIIGAFTFVTFLPNPIAGQYTVIPIQIYGWAVRPQADFQGISAAAIIVILGLMLILNGLAIVVRARLSRHIQW